MPIRNTFTLKILVMPLFAIIRQETCQLTSMTYHLVTNIALQNGEIGVASPSQPVHQQENPRAV